MKILKEILSLNPAFIGLNPMNWIEESLMKKQGEGSYRVL